MNSAQVRDRLVDLAYGAGWGLVGKVPEGVAMAAFRFGADLAARRGGRGAAQLRRNLARVVPDAGQAAMDELVRDGLRSYARYWCETFRLPVMDPREVHRRIDEVVVGRNLLDAGLERGKGVVIALPHMGNFDAAGIWLVGHCGGFTTVAERLRPESLFQRFLAYRESLGFEILPASGARVLPYRVMLQRLRANKVVCLPADRDLGRRGVPVTFFGERATMPAGPARLAAATGAQLIPAGLSFTRDGWGLRFHPPIEVADTAGVPAATQRMADAFATDIAAHPADWHMLQKLWTADLPTARPRAGAGKLQESAGAREAG